MNANERKIVAIVKSFGLEIAQHKQGDKDFRVLAYGKPEHTMGVSFSIVRNKYSYGARDGKYEIAVSYDTEDDKYYGHLTPSKIREIIASTLNR